MGNRTNIAWTDATWNPVTGCSRVSDGCRHCYAETLSLRMGWSQKPWSAANAAVNVVLHPERLRMPYGWKKPTRCFVNSMSDLFHPLVPDSFIAQVFEVMQDLPQHTFQILTKRPERLVEWSQVAISPHIWLGTSVEDARVLQRIDRLRESLARVRFISFEPLIGPVGDVDLTGIHWAIVGGESGPQHRPMDLDWARSLRDQCLAQGVAFFFKQQSSLRPGQHAQLDGVVWQQYPEVVSGASTHQRGLELPV